jgi:PAS domain S-box-containing protein
MNSLSQIELTFLLDSIEDPILYETTSHEIIYVNQSFCDLFKSAYTPSELIGKESYVFAKEALNIISNPPYFFSRVESCVVKAEKVYDDEVILKDASVLHRDFNPQFKDGQLVSYLWRYKKGGQPSSKTLELGQQQKFYENIMNNIPEDIAILDNSQKYLFINKAGLAHFDDHKWIIGKDDIEYVEKFNKDSAIAIRRKEKFNEAVKEKKTIDFEEVLVNADNKKTNYLRRYTPIISKSDKVEYLITYGFDITQLRKGEEAIYQNFKHLMDLIDSIEKLIIIVDGHGNVVYLNPVWRRLTGISRRYVVGNNISEHIKKGGEKFLEYLELFTKGLHTNVHYNTSVSLVHANQEERMYRYYINRFTQPTSSAHFYAVLFLDITDQLTAEQELLNAANKERKLSELKTNFMTMVSHELRIPLSIILSSVEIMEMKYDRILDKDFAFEKTYLTRITDQVDKMTHLMNEFLLVSKIESGKIMANLIELDVKVLVKNLSEEMFLPWKDGRNVTVEYKGKSRKILFDESMLRHIIINLLNNAFKYSPTSSVAPKLRIRFSENHWYITVVDRGIGISAEDQKAIHSPFVRGSNVGDIEGTGLGFMTIVFFTEQHNGFKLLRSRLNEGTIVTIKFPYQIKTKGK